MPRIQMRERGRDDSPRLRHQVEKLYAPILFAARPTRCSIAQPETEQSPMNFIIEEPLRYEDALFAVRKFERQYQVSTEDLFKSLAESKGIRAEVHPDDLYEWRSYYEFVKRVDAKLARLLKSNTELTAEDLIYSSGGPNCASSLTGSKKQQDLCLAA